jgi:hypothetical protein
MATTQPPLHPQGESLHTHPDPPRYVTDFDADADLPVTTQTDQLRRSMEIEKMGPQAYMEAQETRIRDRQGAPPIEPRQVHGIAPPQKPR